MVKWKYFMNYLIFCWKNVIGFVNIKYSFIWYVLIYNNLCCEKCYKFYFGYYIIIDKMLIWLFSFKILFINCIIRKCLILKKNNLEKYV